VRAADSSGTFAGTDQPCMERARFAVVFGLLAAVAPTQEVGWSVSTPIGLSAFVFEGTFGLAGTPPGILPASGAVHAPPRANVAASCSWSATSSSAAAEFESSEHTFLSPAALPGSFASVGLHHFVLLLTSSAPAAVELRVAAEQTLPPGATMAPLLVDVGDDGIVDWWSTAAEITTAAQIGPAGLRIRVRCGGTLSVPGTAARTLSIRATPANGLSIQPAALGCSPHAPALQVAPSFVGSGVRLVADTTPASPAVLVLGLAAQPLLLPPFGTTPCLLLPAPDVLALRVDATPFELALPAAVRPVVVWSQAVFVAPQLLTSTAYLVAGS
jgi:hypothetical protein